MARTNVYPTVPQGQILELPDLPVTPEPEPKPATEEPAPLEPPQPPPTEPAPEPPPPAGSSEEEFADWRWRNEQKRVRMAHVRGLAEDLGVDPTGLLNMTQIGRDVQHQRRELREREKGLRDYEADLNARNAYLESTMRQMAEGRRTPYEERSRYDGETRPAATPSPQVNVRDPQQVLDVIARIPEMFQSMEQRFIGATESYAQRIERDRAMREVKEDEVRIRNEAVSFLKEAKDEGWTLPEDLDEDRLMWEANRLGPGLNPNIPYREALETAFAKMVYRHGFKLSQANTVADLESSRGKTFRVPATKSPAPAATPRTETTLEGRVRAAKELGRNVTIGEALENQR